jgi:transcription elongation factor Elf1
MSDQQQNNSGPSGPGLSCPECGFHILVTMQMLLNRGVVYCNNCGLKLSIDQESSKEGLDQLRKLNSALEKAKKAKDAPF